MAAPSELGELFEALPDATMVVDGGRVIAGNGALAGLLGRPVSEESLAALVEEEPGWLAERLPSALASGEALRLHLCAGPRRVPIDVRVGRLTSGAWVLTGRDATRVERAGSVVGRLSSLYARQVSGTDGLASLFTQSESVFCALDWTVAIWRIEGDAGVLDHVWMTELLRNHPSRLGHLMVEQLRERALPLEHEPLLDAAAREGRGSTIDDLPALIVDVFRRAELELPPVDRELFVELGLARGAMAPVFVGDRVTHVVAVGGSSLDERDSAGVQLFASMLSVLLRANQLGDEMARQQRHAALGQMSRQLAHEVRNPLAVILQASRQARKRDPEHVARMLDMIDEEAKRLERLMSDLVSFAGPLSLRMRPTPVAQLVAWSLEALALEGRGPKVDLEVDESLACTADPMLLRQALSHLLSNACSHARERVRVSAAREGERVILRVENDGGPMPEGVAHRVFEPFFSTRPTGTGLGLAVVRRLIEDQGGSVDLETAGDAITFLVDLPASE